LLKEGGFLPTGLLKLLFCSEKAIEKQMNIGIIIRVFLIMVIISYSFILNSGHTIKLLYKREFINNNEEKISGGIIIVTGLKILNGNRN
jgi:threonine/homoserine/homoserine lactone efflux protein